MHWMLRHDASTGRCKEKVKSKRWMFQKSSDDRGNKILTGSNSGLPVLPNPSVIMTRNPSWFLLRIDVISPVTPAHLPNHHPGHLPPMCRIFQLSSSNKSSAATVERPWWVLSAVNRCFTPIWTN